MIGVVFSQGIVLHCGVTVDGRHMVDSRLPQGTTLRAVPEASIIVWIGGNSRVTWARALAEVGKPYQLCGIMVTRVCGLPRCVLPTQVADLLGCRHALRWIPGTAR